MTVDPSHLGAVVARRNGWTRAFGAMRRTRSLSPGGMALFAILAVISGLCEAFGLALVFPLLNYIEAGGDVGKLAAGSALWRALIGAHRAIGLDVSFITLAGGIWVLVFLRQASSFASAWYSGLVKERFTFRLRAAMFDAMIGARAAFLGDKSGGAVASWFGQMAQQSGNVVTAWTTAIALAATLCIYGAGLLWLAPVPTVVAVAAIGALALLFGRFVKAAKKLSRAVAQDTEQYSATVTNRLRNWRLVKLHVAESREAAKLSERARRIADLYLAHVMQVGRLHLIATPLVLAALLVGIYLATAHLGLSLATVVVFVAVVIRLTPIVEAATRLRQTFALSSAALDRLLALVAEAAAQREAAGGARAFAAPTRAIRFEDVSVAYDPQRAPALNGVSVSLPARATVAIVGPSGAGKSTLVNALVRLVEPASGRILLDDVPLAEFDLASLRRGVAMVDQSTQLLPASVEENLRYARPVATAAEIERALELAGALGFVRQLPQGIATAVGEDGFRLSGGQRQRLALARAFLGGAGVIVLDEPTSALDFEAEAAFRAGLRAIRRHADATLLVVAHRASTIADADYVIVLRDGRVEEAGSPAQLRRDPGYYRAMIEMSATGTQ